MADPYVTEAQTNYNETKSNLDYYNSNVFKEALAGVAGKDYASLSARERRSLEQQVADFETMFADINQQAAAGGLNKLDPTDYYNYNNLLTYLGRASKAGTPTPVANWGDEPTGGASTTPALGTAEYTNYLVNQGKTLGMNLEQFRVPTNASTVSAMPQVNMPSPSAYTSSPNIGSAVAGTSGIAALLQQQMSGIDSQRKMLEQQLSQQQTGMAKFFADSSSRQELQQQLEQITGMQSSQFFAQQQSKIAEIEALEQQYNSIVSQRDQQIAQSYDKLGTVNFINNQIGQINRNAAPLLNSMSANINAKAATLQALQGNFDRAQSYIQTAVENATADKRDAMQAMTMFYEMNRDTLSRLDSQYQTAFNQALGLAQQEYERDYELKNTLAQLQLENPQVSIDINGTLESAVSAIRLNPNSPDYLLKTNKLAGGGGSDPKRFTTTQSNDGAIRAGVDWTTFKSLDPEVQNYFINSTDTQIAAMRDAIANATTDKQKLAVRDQIMSSNTVDSVKEHLLKQLGPIANEYGDTSSAWDKVKSFFGF